jgi:hypothetical protein
MKATRILLFLSPLLWFVPPIIPMGEAPAGLVMVNFFYRGVIGRFPGNVLMAFLCHSYAQQLGRDAWPWMVASLRIPFIAPFILAFMPAKYGSAADSQRRIGGRRPAPAKATSGSFDTRFPLLGAYLAGLPQAERTAPQAFFTPVQSNFEFSVFVSPHKLDAFLAGAAERAFAVWTNPEGAGLRIFGAGLVEPSATDGATSWLRAAAPERKIATTYHPSEGLPKFFEYYPSTD